MSSPAELFTLAWQHHQAGRHADAERIYVQIVQDDPHYADAWCFLGAAVQALGRVAEAERHFRRAVELLPNHPSAGNCLGIALAQQGRFDEAAASFEQFIRHWPTDADAFNNLGLVRTRQRRLEDAITSYRSALQLRPDFEAARGNLTQVLQELERPAESLPTRPVSNNPALSQALRSLNQQGVMLAEKGRLAEGRTYFENALRLDPNDADAHVNLGTIHDVERRYDQALAHYQQALLSRPDHAEGHYNTGVVLAKLGRFEEAIHCYHKALALQSDHLDARNNLGNAFKEIGRFGEAHATFEQTLALNPQYGEGHLSRSLLWLLQGDFERGWPGYSWRWKRTGFANRSFTQPPWDGSPLAGRTILLHAEQGFGDTLHFVRYATLVKERGGKVIVECPQSLMPLLRSAPGVDQLVAGGTTLPHFDVQAALPSLPCILQTSEATIPAAIPYLRADPGLVEKWRVRAEKWRATGNASTRSLPFLVGIAWQGNASYPGDLLRSIPLRHFAHLAKVPGVQLVSLQKGEGTEQLRGIESQMPMIELGNELDDTTGAFMDTAAIMMHIDLVISSDTAIPHLAGALGVPVWLALQMVPDWRWLLDRSDCPWYPTMRLFRQTRLGDWDDVFQRMAEALGRREIAKT